MYNSSLKILRLLPPELSHTITINFLKYLKVRQKNIEDPILAQHLMGLDFINPIGLAAGFDKNAEVMHSMFSFGFGFLEVGTITPQPQSGNSKPRVFRLSEDKAIINSLGFNNKGIDYGISRIKEFNRNIPIGVNIGKNASTDVKDAFRDYEYCLRKAYSVADYITLNISSPNTENLRDLQKGEKISSFLHSIKTLHDNLKKVYKKHTPLVVKIAPDVTDEIIFDLSNLVNEYDIDGVICTNTTIDKSYLSDQFKALQGGLSGKPLYKNSNIILKKMYELTNGQIPLIGVGGISSGRDCYEKIKSGASLVQLYTALVYSGPNLINSMKSDLIDLIKTDGYKNLTQVIGKSV